MSEHRALCPIYKKSLSILLATSLIAVQAAAVPMNDETDPLALRKRLEALSLLDLDEVLWLARCIYSESDRKHEQEIVAWVVRNRVETEYRGNSYREVVLEPLQFSAFNDPSPHRSHILSLDQHSTSASWLQALSVALDVYEADPIHRPIPADTRHFYSPISMQGNRVPPWARNAAPLDPESIDIEPERFLFYSEIDEEADPFVSLDIKPSDHIDGFQQETRDRLQSTPKRSSLRSRWKPSGKVRRPARPSVSMKRR